METDQRLDSRECIGVDPSSNLDLWKLNNRRKAGYRAFNSQTGHGVDSNGHEIRRRPNRDLVLPNSVNGTHEKYINFDFKAAIICYSINRDEKRCGGLYWKSP